MVSAASFKPQFGSRRVALVALGCLLASAPSVRAQPGDRENRSDRRDINTRRVDLGFERADRDTVLALCARLNAPEFEAREDATRELSSLGPAAFATLAEVYRQGADFETRVRIQNIVHEQFFWHVLLKHNGFLGIRFDRALQRANDPRVPPDAVVVYVLSVEPDLPADRAGLRAHDMIIAVNGQHLDDLPDGTDFAEYVSNRGADTDLKLTVLRRNITLELEAELIARPLEHYPPVGPLADDVSRAHQQFATWWSEYFALPESRRERTPSSTVFEIPE